MAVRVLSKELQEKAINELNEVPERVKDDIAYIKDWLSQQEHLTARTDDQILVAFLRGSKFSLERTKEKLDTYYTMRSITPEIFDDRDPFHPKMQELLKIGAILPLLKTDPAAPRVIFIRHGIYDPSQYSPFDIFKLGCFINDILLMEDDNFAISGTYVLQDMTGFGLDHIRSASPTAVKKGLMCFQQAYPNRIKGLYFMNTPSVFEAMHKVISMFLTKKMKERMAVYSSDHVEKLYNIIPKVNLPEEYGGDGGKIADHIVYWKNKIESYRQWFIEDARYRTNENKRKGQPKTQESVLGLNGSFRQMSFD